MQGYKHFAIFAIASLASVSITTAQDCGSFPSCSVEVTDLTSTDPDLKGFFGGFTDGTFGYVVPFNNGQPFGKVVRFNLQSFSDVQVLDLASTDPELKGFVGGFTDGIFGYVVPNYHGQVGLFSGKVARFNLQSFSNVEVLDLKSVDSDLKGFRGGFTDGTFGYVVPQYSGQFFGKVARFDLQSFSDVQVLDLTSTDPELKGFVGGFVDGTFGYVIPNYNGGEFGKVARFNLQSFSDVQVLDLTSTDPDLKAFAGGFTDGIFGYVVPFGNGQSGTMARFNLQSFSDVEVLDLTSIDPGLKGFYGGFIDRTFGYVVPFVNGQPFGKVARFNLQSFSDVEVLDLTVTDPDLKGFAGGFTDGIFGYVVPHGMGQLGKVARFRAAEAKCTCANGAAAKGDMCTEPNTEACTVCIVGFELVDGVCTGEGAGGSLESMPAIGAAGAAADALGANSLPQHVDSRIHALAASFIASFFVVGVLIVARAWMASRKYVEDEARLLAPKVAADVEDIAQVVL